MSFVASAAQPVVVAWASEPTSLASARVRPIAQATAKLATPMVLHINCNTEWAGASAGNTDARFLAGALASTWTGASGPAQAPLACVRLRYGVGSLLKTAYIDARSASFQLPPVTNAYADLLTWQAGNPNFSSTFAAAFAQGVTTEPMAPEYTGIASIAAAATLTHPIPPQATAYDFWGNDAAANFSAQLTAYNSQLRQYAKRDYATPAWIPLWGPIDLPANDGYLTVTNNAAAEYYCGLRFYLTL